MFVIKKHNVLNKRFINMYSITFIEKSIKIEVTFSQVVLIQFTIM